MLVSTDITDDHIVFDHDYIHGLGYPYRLQFAISLEGSNTAVVNSYIDELNAWKDNDTTEVEYESYGIYSTVGPGPARIDNNYLSVVGIAVFSPDDTGGNTTNPSDYQVTHNYFFQDPKYRPGSPTSDGHVYDNRDVIELKRGQRWLIDGNIFDGNFSSIQGGGVIMISPRPGPYIPPLETTMQISDVTVSNNIFRNVPNGVCIAGHNDYPQTGQIVTTRRVKVSNNLFQDIDGSEVSSTGSFPNGEDGYMGIVLWGPEDVVFDHNTGYHSTGNAPAAMFFDGDPTETPGVNLQFTNNLVWDHDGLALNSQGGTSGTIALNDEFQKLTTSGVAPAWNVQGNTFMGTNEAPAYPANNLWVADDTIVGFADPGNGDYSITDTGLKGTGTDGSDPGVNMSALSAATVNTITGGNVSRTFAPPVISNVAATNVTSSEATISWTTDTLSNSQVQYGLTTSYGQDSAVSDGSGVSIHAVKAENLSASTTYHYVVQSTDLHGNSSVSADQVFTTSAAPPPVISGISASATQTGAMISWKTNTLSNSQVQYGLTASYGQSSAVSGGSGVTAHAVVLSSLSSGTSYHYAVRSTDSHGSSSVSADQALTTSAPPPPVISGITASVTQTGATISWKTNTLSNSQVQYGLTTSYGQSSAVSGGSGVTAHAVVLSSLSSGTSYHYAVRSTDSHGNLSVSADQAFTTSAPPPPVISGITASVTQTGATISWKTNTLSNSQVQYGLTTSYGQSSAVSGGSGGHRTRGCLVELIFGYDLPLCGEEH